MLNKGGIMIIDDVHLWTGRILADFLDAEEVWRRLTRTNRFAMYRLLVEAPVVLSRWWEQQPLLVRRSGVGERIAGGLVIARAPLLP